MSKITKIIFFYSTIVALLIYFILYNHSLKLAHGVYVNQAQPIKHFELFDNLNNLFTENNLKGHWSLLFFGFSSCQMICPLTMKMLTQTYEGLPKTKKPQIILISVDPTHDSLPVLNRFVHQFNADFIALRGPMSAVNTLQKQLHVPVSTLPKSHGREILLINPDAKVQAYFYYPITSKNLLSDLNQVIG